MLIEPLNLTNKNTEVLKNLFSPRGHGEALLVSLKDSQSQWYKETVQVLPWLLSWTPVLDLSLPSSPPMPSL